MMTFYYTLKTEIPPARVVNKYRDSQLNDVQRVRDFGKLSPKWKTSINPLP